MMHMPSQGVSSSSLKGLTQHHAILSFETLCQSVLGCGEERNEKVTRSVLRQGSILGVSARKPNLAFGFHLSSVHLSSVHSCQLLGDDWGASSHPQTHA